MSEAPPRASAPTILLVEDETFVRDVISETLLLEGYKVIPVGNGFEALEALEGLEDVTLLLTDVSMPGLSGAELARRVSDLRPTVKTLLISGYAMSHLSGKGEMPYLQKPFMPDELMAKINEILGAGEADDG